MFKGYEWRRLESGLTLAIEDEKI